MISANEARELAEKNREDQSEIKLEQIENEIRSAAAHGRNDINIHIAINSEIIHRLKCLGYKVERKSDRMNDVYVIVSWEREDEE